MTEQFNVDWRNFISLWPKIGKNELKVAEILNFKQAYIINRANSSDEPKKDSAQYKKLVTYKRFYVSLALYDIVQEMPLPQVVQKYDLNKALVQTLQEHSSTFAGMVAIFCEKLGGDNPSGWQSLTQLFKEYQTRLAFGIHQDLIDLMRIPFLTSKYARQLFSNG